MTNPPSPVEQPVTIAVLGTHSTGKSTFLARLAHELRRKRISVGTVADLGEQAQKIGMPILYNHTWASTLWFLTRGIAAEMEAWLHADVVLVDRAVPDALGYYRAALEYRGETADPFQIAGLEAIVGGHSHRYDLMFRTTLDPAIPVGRDKNRDSDAEFRVLADKHVGEVLADLDLRHELLPADGHDTALEKAIGFVAAHLDRQPGT